MSKGETPELADDGLCINTECSIRGTVQCPVFRIMRDMVVPKVNNVIHLPNQRGEKAGFRKETFDGYRPRNVIGLEEGRRWIKLTESIKNEDSLSVLQQVMDILTRKNTPTQTAQVIQFPKTEIAL